jgi:general secretion pathway protein K
MNRSEKGMAVILVLMIVALMTAMVVEFASATYTASAALSNWRYSQRLSLAARSGVTLLAKVLSDNYGSYSYTYPGVVEIPVVNILKDFEGQVMVRVEDENAKFNLNSLVLPNGALHATAYASFKKLLKNLDLNEQIADRIADWTDRDHEPLLSGSEEGAKNAYMDSLDELCLIIDPESCKKLLPLMTVYGMGQVYAGTININSASKSVLMALDADLTQELAERIESFRSLEPFKKTSDIVKVAGFEGALGQSLMGRIAVKASNFRIISTASENRVKRIIDCVVEASKKGIVIKHWQET